MKKEKSLLWGNVAGSLLTMAVGALLLIKPNLGSSLVATIIGWAIVGLGVLALVVCISNWAEWGLPGVLVSGMALCFGVYLVRNPLSLASFLGLALGVYLGIQGLSGLAEAFRLKQVGYSYKVNMILSVLLLIIGVVLLIFPLSFSKMVMTIGGAVLLVCGAVNLVLRSKAATVLQKEKEVAQIVDAEQ